MKNFKRVLKSTVAVLLSALMLFAVVGCGDENDPADTGTSIVCEKTKLGTYETVKLTAMIDGVETAFADSDCIVSNPSLAKVEDGVLKIVGAVETDTTITVRIVIGDKVLTKDFVVKKPASLDEAGGVKITITATNDRLSQGESVILTVRIEGTTDLGYTYSVSDPELIEVDSATNTVRAKDLSSLQFDRNVSVTATANADTTRTASKTLRLIAPQQNGRVGYLTTDAIRALGNESITVTSVMQDHYQDFVSGNDEPSTYYGTVKMEDGKWYSAWKTDEQGAQYIEESYLRGEDGYYNYGTYTDYEGKTLEVTGHAMMQQYISKDNEVQTALVKDYVSRPGIWEMGHLWNHIDQLAQIKMDRYTYEVDDLLTYHLTLNPLDMDELYLFTYLSISLTPLISDTINDVIITLNDDGDIVKMVFSTEVLYDGGATTDPKEADYMEWTTVELTFGDVGTTSIPEIKPYEKPANIEILDSAIASLKAADSYRYELKDTMLRAPSSDSGDYEMSASVSASAYAGAVALDDAQGPSLVNGNHKTGTVGQKGWITPQGVLFEETTQYQYVMEGEASYRREYTGYKPFDGYYEKFIYNAQTSGYIGIERVKGDMYDALPKFDFSTYLFKQVETGYADRYVFELQESAVTGAIAKEVSAHSTAKSGSPMPSQVLTITVDKATGNIKEIKYPYSFTGGTYVGYATMAFYDIGSATLPDANLFNGYIEREVKTSWSQFTSDYRPNHSTAGPAPSVDTLTTMKAIFGEEAANIMVAPTLFMDILGDTIGGGTGNESGSKIWFGWRDGAVEGEYIDYLSFTVAYPVSDENGHIDNEAFEDVRRAFTAAFTNAGYSYDGANSTAPNASGSRYLCFAKETAKDSGEGIEIVIENTGTKWLYITIYNFGDWTLKK